MKLKLLLPLLLSGAMPVYGQVDPSVMAPESTDSLQKCKIRYFSPGRGGMNRVWNFFKYNQENRPCNPANPVASSQPTFHYYTKDHLG
ncbi:hypothetical protein, partial [Prevotella sp. P6B4]|uniref:hypothetical protein n=1 Tax=Prevotella sp. P6B4 TaxID=1410614 RepID=UPI0012DF2A64